MKEPLEILAIIPARGGSKSIPGKNIKLLGEHPLIAYSVEAGRSSRFITRTIVSTDDEQIAAVAKRYGAEVPFMRPKDLAGDTVTDLPVFQHALQWLGEQEGYKPDMVVQLRPTSPFRPVGSVDEAIRLLMNDPEADAVRAVTPSDQNPFKMWFIVEGRMVPIIVSDLKEPYNMPRQKLPPTYWQTGHIEVIRSNCILEKQSLTGDIILPYEIDSRYAIDLDTLDQWAFAEYVMKERSISYIQPNRSHVT